MYGKRSRFLTVMITLGLAFFYIPMILLVIYSFNYSKLVPVWGGWSFRWYKVLFESEEVWNAVSLSLKIAFVNATFATILGMLAAICMVRFGQFRGRTLFGGMLVAPLVMPEVITGLSLLVLFITLKEAPGATEGGGNAWTAFKENFGLLAEDAQLRRFILVRGLLISTALAPPFMVALRAGGTDGSAADAFGSLGLLVIASAGASLLSSYVWGRLSDRSSRWVLILSGVAGALALAATLTLHVAGALQAVYALPLVLFGLMIAYQGVRLGRSTHLVDMASEDTRAAYTALSNTIIGVLLLAGGGFSLVAAYFGTPIVIGLMAGMSLLAALFAFGLDEVQSGD